MPYQKTTWTTGDPITLNRMMNIENGIEGAYTELDSQSGKIQQNANDIDSIETSISSLSTNVTNLEGRVNSVTSNSQAGENAWKEIKKASQVDESTNPPTVSRGISNRLDDLETATGSLTTVINGAKTDVNGTVYDNIHERLKADENKASLTDQAVAQINNTFAKAVVDKDGTNYGTVEARFQNIEDAHKTLNTDYTAIKGEIVTARGVNGTNLNDRFVTIESTLNAAKSSYAKRNSENTPRTFDSIDDRLEDIETELVNAHNGNTYESLDQRLDAIDGPTNSLQARIVREEELSGTFNSQISNVTGRVATLETTKVDKDSIKNNSTTTDEGYVLDARMGKTLQDQITNLQNSASTEGSRIDALEAELDMSAADGSRRIDLVEADISAHDTELTNAHTSTANNASYTDIKARFEADETQLNNVQSTASSANTLANTLQESVQIIANELGMVQNDSIVNTNTRIDTIANKIANMEATMGGQSDFGDRISAAESNITTLQGDVQTLQDKVSGDNGLEERMADAEADIADAALAAQNAQQTADNAATQASVTTLTGRVTALEGRDTIIRNDVEFDAETGNPIITNPSTDCDYLIQNTDGKYYYWRYFTNEGWQLISAGGTSESGNTSGMDLTEEQYNELTEHAENTDYYVSKEDGVHHYRWVLTVDDNTGEESLAEVEIGSISNVDNENVKKYNIALETITDSSSGATTNYLNFYEFNADESNVIDVNDEENEITRLRNKQIRHILLPATGGGGSAVTQARIRRITPATLYMAANSSERTYLQFFFTIGEANETASYEIIVNGVTVRSGDTLTSGDPGDYTQNWPTGTVPTGFYSIDITDYFTTIRNNQSITIHAYDDSNTAINASNTWTVNVINFQLESEAPNGLIISSDEPVSINYTPYGAIDKTLHVVIDEDTENETTIPLGTRGGTPSSYEVPAQEHGLHKIDMFLTADVNTKTLYTSHIYREYIWYNVNDTENPVILASPQNGQTIYTTAYNEITVPYSVYHKESGNYEINYYLNYGTSNQVLLGTETVSGNVISSYSYTPITNAATETQTLTIKVEDKTATVTMVVSALEQDVAPVSGAIIDFDPALYSNNSINREPEWKASTSAYDSYEEWKAGTSYAVNANVIYDGYAYRCRTQNRDATWDPTKWAELGAYKYTFKTSSNFNWSNDANGGGYKEDVDGKCFVVKAGTHVDLNYKMFKRDSETGRSAVYRDGMEMKIIFKTMAVRNVDAIWFSNVKEVSNKPIGIQLEAHKGWLKTDKASNTSIQAENNYEAWVAGATYQLDSIVLVKDTIYKCIVVNSDEEFNKNNWLAVGKIETSVDSTNTYLYFPYSEEDKIELDININKYTPGNNFIMSYEDGVPSKAYPYNYSASGDGLYHLEGQEGTIRIGSDDCDVYIYRLRIYNKSLGTGDILQNFIADGKTVQEKISRYDRNCIYWDSEERKFYTTKSATAKLDPIKLAERMPNVKVLMLDCPTFTLSKKSYIPHSSLRCIQAPGGNMYSARDEDNWFFQDGFHAGQGTTSDNYGQSGRNVDFLFMVDGKHFPTKKKNLSSEGQTIAKSTKSSVLIGNAASKWDEETETWIPTSVYNEETEEWEPSPKLTPEERLNWTPHAPEYCSDWKGNDCKVGLTSTSVPNNYFNLKVNIASSENVNNALFAQRFGQFLPYNSPAKQRDSRIKNNMEFVPAVLFVRENAVDEYGNPSGHSEFNDCEWHYYALGNIGDSKKTDYTRAYDPDDMDEFTVENSDNNTNNGQFQSGVFYYENERVIETDFDVWKNNVAYKHNAYIVKDWRILQYTGEDMAELGEGETYTWDSAQWSDVTPTTTKAYKYIHRINPNPMDYVFPIDPEEWNVQLDGQWLNRKHLTLTTEDFDGDHSFEFRYACKGDYRDGDLVNDTTGMGEAQYSINKDVVFAFYEWLLTADKDQFVDEADQWIVKDAMEFFYAFTHYYTMMDNRAKNTFWHFAKTGTHHRVSRPVPELLHIYDEFDGTNYTRTEDTVIDPEKTYYTEYAFDIWAYDMDTAAGIDNNGALVFPYGKEDEDYRVKGVESSGWAFNGAGSIFWRRLKTAFAEEIRDIMNRADSNCFNSENLIKQFDSFQECFPEEIWRLDIERKYIRTFTGASVDNSLTVGKQNSRFLTSMMQGRKKYQRRQWIRNQSVYFNSKYTLADITNAENTTEFNIITPTGNLNDLAVYPSYNLKLTPYQDMYLNIRIGNGGPVPQIRAEAGKEYTFDLLPYSSGTFQETRIYIYGFNYISGLGNLAAMYPYSFTLSALGHLKTLDVGTDSVGYVNANLTGLPLKENSKLPLLEVLNIKNCSSLSEPIELNTANNIRVVEATGSALTGITLPEYTNIETLHLPNTVTTLSLTSARKLTDLKILNNIGEEDYSHLTKLDIRDSDYSSNINWMDIAIEMLSNAESIYLYDLQLSTINNIQTLQDFADRKEQLEISGPRITLAGVLKVLGDYSDIEKATYEDLWNNPGLTLDVSEGHLVTKYRVIYQYPDGTHIATLYINRGDQIVDLWTSGYLKEMPALDATARYTYQFGLRRLNNYVAYSGWLYPGDTEPLSHYTSRPPVDRNLVITAYFQATTRTYDVNWFMSKRDTVAVKTATAEYGGGYELVAPTVKEIRESGFETVQNYAIVGGTVTYDIFNGWEKLPININPNIDDTSYNIYATWLTREIPLIDLFPSTMTGTELTAEQLFVLAHMDNATRAQWVPNLTTGATFTCTTGHDGPDDGTLIVGNSTVPVLRTDVDFTYDKGTINIRPFQTDSGAFTLVLDYCFNMDEVQNQIANSNKNFATLASTYYSNISDNTVGGFALFYNLNESLGGANAVGPRLGFGDMFNDITKSVALGTSGTAGLRNIVVLRYVPNNDQNTGTLHIYSGYTANTTVTDISLPMEVSYTSLDWSNIKPDNKLLFGRVADNDSAGNYSSIINNSVDGLGTIFWSKYWDYDLGEGACMELASWPHEEITYAITKLNNAATSSNSSAIFLTAMEASAHGLIYQPVSTSSPQGWGRPINNGGTVAHEICQNRVFAGLPTILQSMIAKQRVDYRTVSATDGLYGTSYTYDTNNSTVYDYIYLQSSANLAATSGEYEDLKREDSDNIYMYPWVTSDSITVYDNYISSSRRWSITSTNTSSDKLRYFNFRFPYQAITAGNIRVFKADTLGNTATIVEAINNNTSGLPGLKTGDIFLDTSGESPQAYIFVDTETIVKYGVQYKAYEGIFNVKDDSGAWVPAVRYNTRSMVTGSTTSLQFVTTSNGRGQNSVIKDGVSLVYSFSI